jgi:hypothetical protein
MWRALLVATALAVAVVTAGEVARLALAAIDHEACVRICQAQFTPTTTCVQQCLRAAHEEMNR